MVEELRRLREPLYQIAISLRSIPKLLRLHEDLLRGKRLCQIGSRAIWTTSYSPLYSVQVARIIYCIDKHFLLHTLYQIFIPIMETAERIETRFTMTTNNKAPDAFVNISSVLPQKLRIVLKEQDAPTYASSVRSSGPASISMCQARRRIHTRVTKTPLMFFVDEEFIS